MNKKVESSKKLSLEKTKELKRFIVTLPSRFSIARSLSPGSKKNLIQNEIDSSKLVRKYKMMRNEDQERDIRLNQLISKLQEEIAQTFEGNDMKIVELLLLIVEMTIEYYIIYIYLKTHDFKFLILFFITYKFSLHRYIIFM